MCSSYMQPCERLCDVPYYKQADWTILLWLEPANHKQGAAFLRQSSCAGRWFCVMVRQFLNACTRNHRNGVR